MRYNSANSALYPRLWDNLVFSFAPCIQYNSPNAHDFSPYGRDPVETVKVLIDGPDGSSYKDYSPIGPIFGYSSQYAHELSSSSPIKIANPNTGAITIQIYFRYDQSGYNYNLIRSDSPATGDTKYYGYGLAVDSTYNFLTFFANSGAALAPDMKYQWRSPNNSVNYSFTKAWNHVIVCFWPGSAFQFCVMCINGVWLYPTVVAGLQGTPVFGTKVGRIGSIFNSAVDNYVNLQIALLNIWNRPIGEPGESPQEVQLLVRDPLALFRPRKNVSTNIDYGFLRELDYLPQEEVTIEGY